jgi:hypothetical protein
MLADPDIEPAEQLEALDLIAVELLDRSRE